MSNINAFELRITENLLKSGGKYDNACLRIIDNSALCISQPTKYIQYKEGFIWKRHLLEY
jgi:hypothetical protein